MDRAKGPGLDGTHGPEPATGSRASCNRACFIPSAYQRFESAGRAGVEWRCSRSGPRRRRRTAAMLVAGRMTTSLSAGDPMVQSADLVDLQGVRGQRGAADRLAHAASPILSPAALASGSIESPTRATCSAQEWAT